MHRVEEISNSIKNQTQIGDQAVHSWYQFVLGYPPHLVRRYISKFGIRRGHLVLDPFCGTGTTNVECKKHHIESLGLEANPVACFASTVKTNWHVSPVEARIELQSVIAHAMNSFERFGLSEALPLFSKFRNGKMLNVEPRLTDEQNDVLPKDFISPRPLRRVLILKQCIDAVEKEEIRNLFLLGLANLSVNHASNVAFGPEIYVTKSQKDVFVLNTFHSLVERMIFDLESLPTLYSPAEIIQGDARRVADFFPSRLGAVNFVITSPPYPNEKDYTRNTRLETVILGLISSKQQLRLVKEQLLRSNSRNIFVNDDDQDYVKHFDSVSKIAEAIEQKRLHLNKTSGFEKLYHKIVRHYFGGMYRHLASLKSLLAPNARLAYVVGDQMSFFRIQIPTAMILGEIAEELGYQIEKIELWRTRLATATRKQIDENVLILRN